MNIYLDDYIFYISDINYFSLYNFKHVFQLYYHNNINYCDNIEFIKMIELFTIDDFLCLGNNKLSKNALYLMNKYCTVNLYNLLHNGYKYFDKDMLYDLFVPFENIKIYKNKYFIKENNIYPNLNYFEDIIDIDKFNMDYYNYKYVFYR
ncbi:unknown similar to AMEV102 [Choristoneura rosaceana entomopoxvirus 'L']|uniref:N1R/p28-like protein n=1 Tax=Choristoneura rosaceana entomopoxvirus 'L' TaxID=1293539 RepID=A0ABM9QKE8_9POXV|nr:unknown similar to AMEV102 [Choristoneura rosaceana entomopoxvirus 'L']CCU56027.1 unknown similar to AMEV102 [Choristoneura rosaceana entomopoxvirus 'L']